MNSKRIPRQLAGAALLVATYLAAGGMHAAWASPGVAPRDTKPVPAISPSDTQSGWVCSMHAEVHQHAPGKCPICKMKLVKAKPRD